MNLLALHAIAAARGDGLHPELRRLLEQRTAIEADPQVVDLATHRPDRPVQAGPSPATREGLFVPGNVLRLVPQAAEAKDSIRSTKKA